MNGSFRNLGSVVIGFRSDYGDYQQRLVAAIERLTALQDTLSIGVCHKAFAQRREKLRHGVIQG
jgi:hypothetical protein